VCQQLLDCTRLCSAVHMHSSRKPCC
jgi:hypothetical protein